MSHKFTPQERLSDFLLKGDTSLAATDTLHNFLCNYDPNQQVRVINAPLERHNSRTSVHIAAGNGLTPLLRILLIHGGKQHSVNY